MTDDSAQPASTPFGYEYTNWYDWYGDFVGGPKWVYLPSLQRNIDRERGFLSKADRRLLLETHELDLSNKTQRNARTRIRGRVLSAYFDAQFLQFISPRDRELIIENARKRNDGLDFREGFKEFVRFSYLGLLEDEHQIDISRVLEEAVQEAEEEHARTTGKNVSVQVEVDITPVQGADIETLERRYSTHRTITEAELDVLVNSEHTDDEPTIDAAEIDLADAIYYDAQQSATVDTSSDREEAEEIVTWLRDFFDEYDVKTRDDLEETVARLKTFDEDRCDELLTRLDALTQVAPHFEEQLAERSKLSEQDAKLVNDILRNPDNLDVEAALKKEVRPRLAGDEWEPAEDEYLQKFIARVEVARDSGDSITHGEGGGDKRWEQVRSIAEFDEAEWSDYMEDQRIELCRSDLRDVMDQEEISPDLIKQVNSWEEFSDRYSSSEQTFWEYEYMYSEGVLDSALEELKRTEYEL